MLYNCKAQFTALLRRAGIKYETSKGQVSIDRFYFSFFDDAERVVIRTPLAIQYSFSFDYASPDHVLNQYYRFRHMVRTATLMRPECLNPHISTIGLS